MPESRAPDHLRGVLYAAITAFFMVVQGGCVVTLDPPANPPPFSLVESSDTIGPFTPLSFALAAPVQDSTLSFVLSPPLPYSLRLTGGNDTVLLHFSLPLLPSTTYRICMENDVLNRDGSSLAPRGHCLSWQTSRFWLEQEPNDTRATADTVQTPLYATFHTANDTDFFVLALPESSVILVRNVALIAAVEVFDLAQNTLALVIPDRTGDFQTPPLPPHNTVVVKAWPAARSTGTGYYRLDLRKLSGGQ